mgnify:CR=1 FL=1
MAENREQIIRTEYSEIMQKSYIDYAMSVIIARALPDVRDGLKPVQRRTLYDMHELGIRYDRPYRKCARIVGDTMGKYHPHGDSSIYGALVVMAQDFKYGMPLVDGHGNFGSIEGDGAAAMRYTEARLQKITQQAYLADLDKDVVDFIPNFDATEKEPSVLPVKVPNILINGAEGIANEVGATKIGDPVDKWNSGDKEGGVLAVESWYSWNSLDDYTDNIYSIRNAYYGSLDGTVASASLCSIMKKVNPTLNDMVVKQIQETITAINDIPHPFRNNLGATTEVKNAQNQCAFLCSGLALVRGKLAGE